MKISKQLAIVALLVSGQYLIAMQEGGENMTPFAQEIVSRGRSLSNERRSYAADTGTLLASEKSAATRSARAATDRSVESAQKAIKALKATIQGSKEAQLSAIVAVLNAANTQVNNIVQYNELYSDHVDALIQLIDNAVESYNKWAASNASIVNDPAMYPKIREDMKNAMNALARIKSTKLILQQ